MRSTQPASAADPIRFGTDGIRGVANRGTLAPDRVLGLGSVMGALLHTHPRLFHNPLAKRLPAALRGPSESVRSRTVLVGRDTRASGEMIASALAAGLLGAGWDVVDVGVVPTPALAFLTRARGVRLGVMITASHNPYPDNGIKLISPEGLKVPDSAERRIEQAWAASPGRRDPVAGVGRLTRDVERREAYVESLVRRFSGKSGLRRFRVVLDCAHGAACSVAPTVFGRLGAEIRVIHDAPDGTNINRRAGALHPQALAREVLGWHADAGFAFDGDGDRVVAVDGGGAVLDGDHALAILGRHLKSLRRLPRDTVVSTVMCNLGLRFSLEEAGIRLVTTPVGDRWVLERMLRDGLVLGGEQSGHLIFLDDATTGDGLLTALRLLAVAKATGRSLARLAQAMRKLPQVLLNVRVARKPPLDEIPEVAAAILAAERTLGDRGRVLVRYSGTEPLARVMVEGEDSRSIRGLAGGIARAIRRILGG